MARRKPREKELAVIPLSRGPRLPPRPPGPPRTDLAPAHPAKLTECALKAARRQAPPIWVAINTVGRYKRWYAARWRWRRGCVFLHWRMMAREERQRPTTLWFDNTPLRIHDYRPVPDVRASRDVQAVVLVPTRAAMSNPLDAKGRLTRAGLESLDDQEFVWPWIDGKEAALSAAWEREYPDHWYGHDSPAPGPAVMRYPEDAHTFWGLYARMLRELGRAGPGTRLGRWLDTWLERAEESARRLDG